VSDFVQVVILCEERQQEVFARYFLVSCGVDRHRIRINICPKGKMAGEQYVREQYPKEVRAYRSRSNYQTVGIVVVTDADVRTVAGKFHELEGGLEGDCQAKRQAQERVALLIPKRNIETWIHYLWGESVNETDIYRRLDREGNCEPIVSKLARKPSYTLTASTPSSLREACEEIRRIVPDKRCEDQLGC
jgi:hypothetical protein